MYKNCNFSLDKRSIGCPIFLLKAICREFEIDVNVREKFDIMEIFQDFLLERYAQNERVLLIIDEA
jgi:hypothetical protein